VTEKHAYLVSARDLNAGERPSDSMALEAMQWPARWSVPQFILPYPLSGSLQEKYARQLFFSFADGRTTDNLRIETYFQTFNADESTRIWDTVLAALKNGARWIQSQSYIISPSAFSINDVSSGHYYKHLRY
jgi:hypothetical protein